MEVRFYLFIGFYIAIFNKTKQYNLFRIIRLFVLLLANALRLTQWWIQKIVFFLYVHGHESPKVYPLLK